MTCVVGGSTPVLMGGTAHSSMTPPSEHGVAPPSKLAPNQDVPSTGADNITVADVQVLVGWKVSTGCCLVPKSYARPRCPGTQIRPGAWRLFRMRDRPK